MSNIKNIVKIGKHQTYDLEIDHSDHQFYLANGVLTSNSHAVAYAIDSYWTAYLMTHYKEHWISAYLESMSSNDDNRAKAFSEVRALGYTIVPIDIRHATASWSVIDNDKLMPSLITCKGVGESAAKELDEKLRWVKDDEDDETKRPFETIEELLWNLDGSWRPGKFNKRALEGLIRVGAFESLDIVGEGKMFNNYHHMYCVIINHMSDIKKSPKKDPQYGRKVFYELIREYEHVKSWSRMERVENSIKHFGTIDINTLAPRETIQRIESKGIQSIDDYTKKDLYWFFVAKAIPKKTKNQRNYLLLHVVGSSGKQHKMYMWNWDRTLQINPYTLVLGECSQSDFGFATSQGKLRLLDV